jgi:Glycosyl hydrolase family 47
MFESIENATKTDIANSAIDDVTQVVPSKADRMESFWLAETLKYFYLIFSEPDLISLDDYILYVLPAPILCCLRLRLILTMECTLLTWWLYPCRNTEAHPFKRSP